MNVAPAAKPRQAASSLRDSKRYFVQFGTYHLLASAESDCPAFSSLGAVTIVRSRVPEIGFYCRTATSRDHDEAMSLVRAAKATMNRVAMLVADARPTN